MACDLGIIISIVVIFAILSSIFPILRRTITYYKITGPVALILTIIAWYFICVI